MEFKEQFSKIIVALVLFSALMTSNAIQIVHLFEEHEHHTITCDEHSESHIHLYEAKCDICCNFFNPLNYKLSKNTYKIVSGIIVKSEENFDSLQLHSFKITNKQLRAPPVYS